MDRTHRTRAPIAVVLILAALAASCGSYDRNPPGARAATTTRTTTTRPAQTSTTTTTTTTRPGQTTAPTSSTTSTRPTPTPPPPTGTIPPTTQAQLTPLRSLPPLPGRLAVIDRAGRLVSVRPNDATTTVISDASAGSITVPTWSPDAAKLAWAATSPFETTVQAASARDGANRERGVVGSTPLYLSWTSNRGTTPASAPSALTLLRPPADNQFQLSALTLSSTSAEQSLAQNATVFYGVSPDGTRALAHVGRDDLVVIDLARGASRNLTVKAGSFRTPVWLSNTEVLVATPDADTEGIELLARVNVDTGARRDLLRFQGTIDFAVETQSRRLVAYQVTGGGGGGANPAFAPRPQQSPTTPPTTRELPLATIGRLSLLDLANGQNRPILESGALAFMWSPRADRLAFLAARGENQVQWRFWSDATIESSTVFAPGEWTRQYVAAFPQYNEGLQFFSPDGRAFVFTGRLSDQEAVFIQPFDTRVQSVPPARLIDGSFALWSPV